MTKQIIAAGVFGWLAAGAPALAGGTDAALRAANAIDSQLYLGTGKGVIVSVLDSGIDATHPALRGSVYKQKDFTGEKKLDDDKGGAGHGTGIAGILVGHDVGYTGLAPAARLLNARIDTSADVTSDLWAGNGLIWSAKAGAKVANISLGNKAGQGPLTDKFTLMADYVAERYGMNVVVAAGNENDSAVRQVPGGAYNGYTVGALGGKNYQRTTLFSNYADDDDARTKPDLVAPGENVGVAAANWEKRADYAKGTGTSFAAPIVGGVLAQLIGYGKAKDLPIDPLLMKAILMTSATKSRDADGKRWDPRDGNRDSDFGYVFSQPLDDEQGAGAVDGVAAYRLYAKKKAHSTPLNVWKEGKMKGDQTVALKLGKLTAGQRLDATLTWFRHVAYKDKNDNGADGKDTFYQSASLADFTLALLRDGVPIAGSDSSVDNVEHLSWTLEKTANYSLEVYRFADSGLKNEAYAVAARVLNADAPSIVNMALAAGVQRGAAYEASGEARGFEAVPEPGGMVWVVVGMGWVGRRRQR